MTYDIRQMTHSIALYVIHSIGYVVCVYTYIYIYIYRYVHIYSIHTTYITYSFEKDTVKYIVYGI